MEGPSCGASTSSRCIEAGGQKKLLEFLWQCERPSHDWCRRSRINKAITPSPRPIEAPSLLRDMSCMEVQLLAYPTSAGTDESLKQGWLHRHASWYMFGGSSLGTLMILYWLTAHVFSIADISIELNMHSLNWRIRDFAGYGMMVTRCVS